MALPSTGGTSSQVLLPGVNPLNVRYGQIAGVFIRDYLNSNGTVNNLAAAAAGLGTATTATGTAQLFTPFAADNLTIRQDLLWNASGGSGNQGWFNLGLIKEDSISSSPEQTVQQTPSAQYLRTVRNVYTKIDDKVMLTPLENSQLIQRLRWNLPLSGWTPSDGTAGYGLARANTDVFIERQLIVFLVDSDSNMIAEVYPRLGPDKTGKTEYGRKNPYAPDSLSWEVEPDPFSQCPMWLFEVGSQWNSEGTFFFGTTPPAVSPITGLKANVTFPTLVDLVSPTYTAQTQATSGGSWTNATVTGSPTVSGGFTTIQITGLTASQVYNAVQVTGTGTGSVVAVSAVSAPFTATSS